MKAKGIEQIKEALLNCENPVRLVQASTGSGKSTQIPLWFLENSERLILVEPRRVAVKSLYYWLCNFVEPQKIGYQIRFEKVVPDGVSLLIVTPGILSTYFVSGFPFEPTLIILDEFHERSRDLDFLLAVLLKKKKRILILSAAMEAKKLQQLTNGELFSFESRVYPVEVSYLGENDLPSQKDLCDRIVKAIKLYPWRVCLVFVPGKSEVRATVCALQAAGIEPVFGIFGNQDPKWQESILFCDQKRVLVSTNLLESSITVEDVDLVIDSGLCRELNLIHGREVLCTRMIAMDRAIQRSGRTGRTCSGKAVRLWSRRGKLEESSTPELLRSSLCEVLLDAVRMGDFAPDLPWLDPPPKWQWEQAGSLMKDWGLEKRKLDKLPINPLFQAMVNELKHRFPAGLDYLLFFLSLASLYGNHAFFQKSCFEDEKKPWDQIIYTSQEVFLEKLGKDREEFERIYAELAQSVDCKIKTQICDRFEMIQVLMNHFPTQIFFYSSRRGVYRSAYSQEIFVDEGLDSERFPFLFVLDWFGIEDRKGQTNLIAGSYFSLDRSFYGSLPVLSSVLADLKVEKSTLMGKYTDFCGPFEIGFSWREIKENLLDAIFMKKIFLLALFSGLEEEIFYLSLYFQEEKQEICVWDYLKSRMQELGVEDFCDLSILEIRDLYPLDYENRKIQIQKRYPQKIQDSGLYNMEYDLWNKKVIFCGGPAKPGSLVLNRFQGWKRFWSYRGKIVGV